MKKRIDTLQLLNTRPFAKAKTIAIVGNAGINEEDNEKINAADCVVRFNNYATRRELQFTKDRFRCDVLFSTFDLHSHGSEPQHVVIGIPFPFKAANIVDKLDKWYPRSVPYMINPYWVRQSCIDLGLNSEGYKHPMPSIGTTCMYQLSKMMSVILTFNPQVFVAGFAWYSDYKKLTIQDRALSLPKANHFNHHYREEMQWIIRNLMHHPLFGFSDASFRILQAFEPHLKK